MPQDSAGVLLGVISLLQHLLVRLETTVPGFNSIALVNAVILRIEQDAADSPPTVKEQAETAIDMCKRLLPDA